MSEFASSSIDLHELVVECSKLALRAGAIIRTVHADRVAGGNSVLDGHLKEQGDLKSVATIADVQAQRVIVAALRSKYPALCIVGEEEDDGAIKSAACPDAAQEAAFASHPVLTSGCLASLKAGKEGLGLVPLSAVVVYIDPLDGTHEFVERRLEHVQTLIGVAVHGTARAGVVGLPFWGQERVATDGGAGAAVELDVVRGGAGGAVIAGAVGAGTVGFRSLPPPSTSPQGLCLASSASFTHPALSAVSSILTSPPLNLSPVVVPACGNKVLSLLLGQCHVALFNMKTSLWDSCATQALLTAAGGRMTDLVGASINYTHPDVARGGQTGNVFGVLATAAAPGMDHADMAARCRRSAEVAGLFAPHGLRCSREGTAGDVCRDTFGQPLSLTTLSEAAGSAVEGYHCPEEEASRYLMSEAARIHLVYAPSHDATVPAGRPQSLFYKRCVMRDLPHVALKARTAPTKLARDVESYLVEARFLASRACSALSTADGAWGGVRVAKCAKAEIHPCRESPMDSRFSLLLEDFAPSCGWSQSSLLDEEQLVAGIEALARWHAFFWAGGAHNRLLSAADVQQLADSVWPVASHWAPSRQAPEMMGQIAELFARGRYGEAQVGFADGSPEMLGLGQRLQDVAAEIARECHFDGEGGEDRARRHPHRTLIHGDGKSGNFFFRRAPGGPSSAAAPLQVGLIDFQWSGFGLGATDLGYYIASCAKADALDVAGERELQLLRSYHEALTSALIALSREPGRLPTGLCMPSFDELVGQYEAALLDVCRIAFAYHWGRIKASPQTFTAERGRMLGPCAYNKDPDVARWLLARCDSLLKKRQQTLKQ